MNDWRLSQEQYVALSVAAAVAFHEAQRGTAAITSPQDYIDALNIAATALSRLVTVYTMDDALHAGVPVKLDLGTGELVLGASEFRRHDGSSVKSLFVRRGDLTSGLEMICGAGVAFVLPVDEAPETRV